MQILYVTTLGITMRFFPEHIKMLLAKGHTIELACNTQDEPVPDVYKTMNIVIHNIPFSRSPLNKNNFKAYKMFCHLINSKHYDIIHTHTPNASAYVRIACRRQRKEGLKVFYTAHGFHFYKGAPLKNWIIYYPIENILSRLTDVLITINKEDYKLAKKHFHMRKLYYIPGIGVDTERFSEHKVSKAQKRKELGIPEDAFVLLSVGELSSRKNQQVVIDALGEMKDNSIYYVIAGTGPLKEQYEKSAKEYGIIDHILLLGQRTDVDELCDMADVMVHPSVREGLGMAPLEGMAAGLPLISSYINGIKDYTKDGVTGCCINSPIDVEEMKNAIKKMKSNKSFRESCSKNNIIIARKFDMKNSVNAMARIYDLPI